jgi:alkaline phosphatase
MYCRLFSITLFVAAHVFLLSPSAAQQIPDNLRELQFQAVETGQSSWGHWGDVKGEYSNWTNHSNRLIPVYSYGVKLDSVQGKNSVYRNQTNLEKLFGYLPEKTLNPKARYFDQTDIFKINKAAFDEATKKNIILIVFDGMDWDTAHAAALYRNRHLKKRARRGWDSGLAFLDYDKAYEADRGYCVTTPHNGDTKTDVNRQVITAGGTRLGGYSVEQGGASAWSKPPNPTYLKGNWKGLRHAYTDSAASATSLNSGRKTYNGSINTGPQGKPIVPLAREMQDAGFSIGIVSSVPISHATPAAVYANNVTRNDYQDLTRDLIGRPSISHRRNPLPGVDVLIGCGWGETNDDDREKQGRNYAPGNKYIAKNDLKAIDVANDGKYIVAQRSKGKLGRSVLLDAAHKAANQNKRLFGFFGTSGGHLPFQTADGKFDPTRGTSRADKYSKADISENPTLSDMTSAALTVLEKNEVGFYLMIEAGDVDWANHNNNIDDAIGAVFSGDDAFKTVCQWVEKNSNWEETQVIVTADHGHLFFLDNSSVFTGGIKPLSAKELRKKVAARQAAQKKTQQAKEAAAKAKAAKAKAAKVRAAKAKAEAAKKASEDKAAKDK